MESSVESGERFTPEYLLSLARRKNNESRSRLAKIIADLFSEEGGALSDRERMLMLNILHRIFQEIEFSVRRYLGEVLAGRADVPIDLIQDLANDSIEVAYPILTNSALLRDEDLVEVIRHRTLEHQVAIAGRSGISENVSDALVDTGHVDVIATLLRNQDAAISRTTMSYLVEESRRVDQFQEPILRREDLPEDLAKRMVVWVSAALRRHIVAKYGLDDTTVDDLLEQAASQAVEPATESGVDSLADELTKDRDIDADLLISTLEGGQIRLFLTLMSRLSGMRVRLLNRMLFEPGGEGLAITCKAMGFSRADYLTIFSYTRQADPRLMRNFQKEKRDAAAFFDRLARSAADVVVRKWRRDADYLAAIRQLDLG